MKNSSDCLTKNGKWPQLTQSWLRVSLVALSIVIAGCERKVTKSDVPELITKGETVFITTNSPQLSALNVEPVAAQAAGSVPLAGRLMWNEDATVRVFTPFAGKVQKILADVNQRVTNGMPLAEILSGEFGQALAEARKAESDYRRAERALNRIQELSQHGAAPQKDVESAQADYENARAEKDRSHARLAMYGAAETASGNSFLLPSPLDGVVVERNVTPGQEVRPDQMLANMPQFTAPLFVVTDPSRLWIQIDTTEADLAYLRPGCDFTFTSRASPGQTFTGQVSTVSEFIDPATRTIKVRGTVDNARHILKAEMFVSVELPAEAVAGASVPAKAVFLSGDKHYVFIQEALGMFSRKEVTVGSEQAGRIPVLEGLQPGQRVVTDGCILLQQVLK